MIGAVIALYDEAKALLSHAGILKEETVYGKPLYTGTAYGKDVMLLICGVGKVNAALGTAIVLARGANTVLNFGAAGGLHEKTEVAKVYLMQRAVQYDFDLTQLNGGEVGTLDGDSENFLPLFVPEKLNLPLLSLASGDRFNDSPVDHALLLRLGADLRDMEGAAIAQVCRSANVPFVSVKAVSDVYGAGSTTEQYVQNNARAVANLSACMKQILESL